MEINLDQTKCMTMGGTRTLEVELDGNELDQIKVPWFNSDGDCKIKT